MNLPDEISSFLTNEVPDGQFIVVYRRIGEEIIIEESNETFIRLFGRGEKMRGKNISEFPKLSHLPETFQGLCRYQNGREVNYLHELEGAYWSIVIKVDDPVCIISGKLIDHPQFDQGSEFLSSDFLRMNTSFSILLEHRDSMYLVRSFSEGTLNYLDLLEGQNILPALENRFHRLKSVEMLLDNIGKGNAYFLEEINTKHGCLKCLMSIFPISHTQFTGAYIIVHILNEEQFYQLHKSTNFLEEYYINSDVGIAIFECAGQKVIRSDSLFDQLIGDKDGVNFKKLLRSEVLQKELHTATFEEMIFNENGSHRAYILAFMPILGENKIMIVLSRKNKVSRSLKEISRNLSAREWEIVNMVVKGNKNAQIAQHLGIAEGTVKKTLFNVYEKLQVESRVDLIKRIYR